MIDELALGLGRHRIVGCPFHGLVRANRLTLPNGRNIDNYWSANDVWGSYRFAVPGVPAVSRTPGEALRDAVAGYQWRTDAVVNMWGNPNGLMLYGRRNINAQALYAVAPGNLWSVRLPADMSPNAEKTQLLRPATLERFGQLSFVYEDAEQRVLPVGLVGYDPHDVFSVPGHGMRLIDSLPDGSQAILGAVGYDLIYMREQVSNAQGFSLLRTVGSGTAESPLTVTLEQLAGLQSGTVVRSDTFTTTTGVLTWPEQAVSQWIDPLDNQVPGDDCKWLQHTTTGSALVIDPDGIPSAQTPLVSFVTGVREATLDDCVIGYWFGPGGQPQPVTLSLGYRLEADYSVSGSATAITDRISVSRYIAIGGVCGPQDLPGDDVYDAAGEFTWAGNRHELTRERVTWQLKVGGVLIDERELVYEDISTSELSGTGPGLYSYGQLDPDPGAVNTWSRERRLVVDGDVIDSLSEAGTSGVVEWGFGDVYPQRALDSSNRFMGSEPVSYWLPLLTSGEFAMPPGIHTKKWMCRPYWWSNHLVCLLHRTRPDPGVGWAYSYGVTAYPGGVSSDQFQTHSGGVLSGARNPFTGDVLLGQTARVTFV